MKAAVIHEAGGPEVLKIESRPIHGRPWEYQFFLDVQTESPEQIKAAMQAVRAATSFSRILGLYPPAQPESST